MTHPGIVDAHLHLWDPHRLRYPWLDDNAQLNRSYLLEDFRRASEGCNVQAMVFVQCEAAPEACYAEAEWVAGLAAEEPRLAGLVAWAPLEKGDAVRSDLARLAKHRLLRGIRRIIQFEPDRRFCLRPDFIAGVRTLGEFGLSFDICTDWSRLEYVAEFAARVPEIPMVLDHIGKPPIAADQPEPWATRLRALALLPNVWCKISGVATEADHLGWTERQLHSYIRVAIEAFGFERTMFGGDWPVAVQAIGYRRWIELLEDSLKDASAAQSERFWRGNATRFYRLDG